MSKKRFHRITLFKKSVLTIIHRRLDALTAEYVEKIMYTFIWLQKCIGKTSIAASGMCKIVYVKKIYII